MCAGVCALASVVLGSCVGVVLYIHKTQYFGRVLYVHEHVHAVAGSSGGSNGGSSSVHMAPTSVERVGLVRSSFGCCCYCWLHFPEALSIRNYTHSRTQLCIPAIHVHTSTGTIVICILTCNKPARVHKNIVRASTFITTHALTHSLTQSLSLTPSRPRTHSLTHHHTQCIAYARVQRTIELT